MFDLKNRVNIYFHPSKLRVHNWLYSFSSLECFVVIAALLISEAAVKSVIKDFYISDNVWTRC